MGTMAPPLPTESLRTRFGDRLEMGISLAPFTAARIGGAADYAVHIRSEKDLEAAASWLWEAGIPFVIFGGGSNVLVSDRGVRDVVLLNRARRTQFIPNTEPPQVWAESGANLGAIARQAAGKGLSGLEWAAGVPGTLGGALVGNAGAHGGDMAGNLLMAEILHRIRGRETWDVHAFGFSYRTSILKEQPGAAVVLSATLRLERGSPEAIESTMRTFLNYRRQTQPPGASMGSMFMNPPGDAAGRLIDAAGLKGLQIGDAQISPLHGNFFINLGNATAKDIYYLIHKAQEVVADKFGVRLDLEIELIGDWSGYQYA